MNKYTPSPEEIPSGFCECGCSKKTSISKVTEVGKGIFSGYPNRRCKGHNGIKGGPTHHLYKGGKIINRGYVLILEKDHPLADSKGYVPEHRLMMCKYLGRLLTSDEHIHHINHNTQDNRIENLQIVSVSEHRIIHAIKWTRETIIISFRRFFKEHGISPSTWSPNVFKGLPNHIAAKRVFGSWENAISESGLPPHQNQRYKS